MKIAEGLLQKIIIESILDLDVDLVYVFGSYLKATFNAESDYDLAYLGEISPEEEKDLQERLELKLEQEVDLIKLEAADLNFIAEIIINGECLYQKEQNLRSAFEMRMLANYLTFEEDRKIVIDAILARGSIFGEGSLK